VDHRGRDAVGREGARARGDRHGHGIALSLVTTLPYRSWTCTVTVGRTTPVGRGGRRGGEGEHVGRPAFTVTGWGTAREEPAAAVIVYEPTFCKLPRKEAQAVAIDRHRSGEVAGGAGGLIAGRHCGRAAVAGDHVPESVGRLHGCEEGVARRDRAGTTTATWYWLNGPALIAIA